MHQPISILFSIMFFITCANCFAQDSTKDDSVNSLQSLVDKTLQLADENREELQNAIENIPDSRKQGLLFLLAHMPTSDAKSLSADFLLEHVNLAYESWEKSPWKEQVSEQLFLNNILPYASVSERREKWRKDFRERFLPLIVDSKSPSQAAVILNQKIFGKLGVKYSTKRKRADQGPFESIEGGTASCTGLSILLIDACRAVGVPARFVGIPRWSDNSGNHSWVEIWDGEWKFTGAAEPTGDELNKGWFTGRASEAKRDEKMYAIYAVSYRKTPQKFPMVWRRNFDPVWAVNVTDRYTTSKIELPDNHVLGRFRIVDAESRERCSAEIEILDENDSAIFSGKSKDERFDANDHLNVPLPENSSLTAVVKFDGHQSQFAFKTGSATQLFSFSIPNEEKSEADNPVHQLQQYLKSEEFSLEKLAEQGFASESLSETDAAKAKDLIWQQLVSSIDESRKKELEKKRIKIGDLEMKYDYRTFGDKPEKGHALYISMHGGGGAPARVNEQQWRNQIRLYEPKEGIYLAPRAPTDTWNLWHQGHIDQFFDRIIENFVLSGQVDPNRVYLMGYSAGGDGVYQLAPRMSDRFAAAAMMAGHPNETKPLGLRNIPFTLHMGGKDAAFKRNQVAEQWKEKLAELHKADSNGYDHWVEIYPDKGHWMDREDAAAIPWMAERTRIAWPKKIVWHQDDVTHHRFYWLAVDGDSIKARSTVTAEIDNQTITVQSDDVESVSLLLDDELLDLDKELILNINGNETKLKVNRTIAAIANSLKLRLDYDLAAAAVVKSN